MENKKISLCVFYEVSWLLCPMDAHSNWDHLLHELNLVRKVRT